MSPGRKCSYVLGLTLAACGAARAAPAELLRFSVSEGRVHNEFFRQGPVAAHLVLSSGKAPRLVVAFPAGNSGTALWFDTPAASMAWQPVAQMASARRDLPDGTLHGVTAELGVAHAALTVRHAILSSVRVIRDYGYTGETPPGILVSPRVSDHEIVWQRLRLDGAPGYYLSVEVLSGTIAGGGTEPIQLAPDADGRLRLRVTALTGDAALRPLSEDTLLTAAANPDSQLRRTLAFLSYEEKLLAGSWRFNTYFGRDTLMSLQLLMPVLKPQAVEAGLGAVLDRLSPQGEVAHEEDIGEYAVLRRLRNGEPASATPIFDYKMIDDDFMLPVIAARYLLETTDGRARAAEFLAGRTAGGEACGAALVRNLRFVVSAAEAFAKDPSRRNLISLKAGETVGNWRDSEDGLGGGRFPYDVNGVFVPAALAAIGRLRASGVLQAYLDAQAEEAIADADAMAALWLREAPPLFEVAMTPRSARAQVARYARRIGVQPSAAVAAVPDEPLVFRAIALDGRGAPVPILNSDEAFALLFLDGPPAEVERIVAALMRPFPAGLMTDVGPVVANPAYAADELQPAFGRGRYHGTVIWSWQQAMLFAGISRQLERSDLTPSIRETLARAAATLKAALRAAHEVRGSELWSWSQLDGRYRVEPFGQRQEDETESNAAQLWSTVYLAMPE
ncbi:MAG: hypothetical protein ACREQZ_04105 [Woeseiaceae bacterium]